MRTSGAGSVGRKTSSWISGKPCARDFVLWQQQRRQNCDDRNDDEEFDERERLRWKAFGERLGLLDSTLGDAAKIYLTLEHVNDWQEPGLGQSIRLQASFAEAPAWNSGIKMRRAGWAVSPLRPAL
jgi:hypothetical protein